MEPLRLAKHIQLIKVYTLWSLLFQVKIRWIPNLLLNIIRMALLTFGMRDGITSFSSNQRMAKKWCSLLLYVLVCYFYYSVVVYVFVAICAISEWSMGRLIQSKHNKMNLEHFENTKWTRRVTSQQTKVTAKTWIWWN